MTRIYNKRTDPRVPSAFGDLQLNACRNPLCTNFGAPPKDSVPRGRGQPVEARDGYSLQSQKSSRKNVGMMMCTVCTDQFRLISNVGVNEELHRFLRQLMPSNSASCPTESCENYEQSIEDAAVGYAKYGQTPTGAQRYQCLRCLKTFSVSPHIGRKLRQPEKTTLIFSLLMNKSAMRRICEVAEVNAVTLYQRIDLIYKKCLRVAQKYELALLKGKTYDRMHIAVDRQDHTFNWGTQFDRRLVVLKAIASAEAKSGYILAQHLNFEPSLDAQEIELAAREYGDDERSPPFRKFARFWLKADYSAQQIDVDTFGEALEPGSRLPSKGLQVFESYSLFAHFFFLAKLLRGVGQIQFSLDREASIQPACLLAFRDWLAEDKLDVFLIKINKLMTNDRKMIALAQAERQISLYREQFPGLKEVETVIEILKSSHARAVETIPHPRHRWVDHPLPNMNEPQKSLLCVTARSETDPKHLAWGYMRGSLNSIDRYFMQVRRRISILERPISSASSNSRRWHGYQAYNPEIGMKLLEIFRVVYNYHLVGKTKQTPAQRMGLIDRALSLEDILAE
jgi:hypothetical protein